MRGRSCWLLFVLVGLALVCEPSGWGSRQTDPYRAMEATVRFDLYRDYLIVAHGTVGPLKGLNFLLDTGANPTILDQRVARKLGLEELPASISVLEGSLHGGKAIVPRLEFGPMVRQNLSVVVQDLSFFQKALPIRIDAVIGMDVLGQSTFVVDYAARHIQFGPYSPLPISVPLHDRSGLAVIDAELNHSPIHLLVDTGAPALIIFEAKLLLSASVLRVGVVKQATNMVGQIESRPVRLSSLSLGGEEFHQEPAFVVPNRREEKLEFDGLVSPAALGFTRVAVDFERGIMGFGR